MTFTSIYCSYEGDQTHSGMFRLILLLRTQLIPDFLQYAVRTYHAACQRRVTYVRDIMHRLTPTGEQEG